MILNEQTYLEHFGKKGMKWGVRKGRKAAGVSRSSGALIDRNNRSIDRIKQARAGKKYQKSVALTKKLIGEAKQNENWNRSIKDLKKQNTRLKAGKQTTMDRIDKFGHVSIANLLVSRTPA